MPVAGALLADWGADVIRIERPEGDPYRGLMTQGIGVDSGGVNMSIALASRGKRSIALDLQTRGGSSGPRTAPRDGRRVPHELPTRSTPSSGARRGNADRSVPEARVRAWARLRRARPRCRQPRATTPSAFWARGGMAHVLTPPDRDQPIGQRGAMGDRNGAMALAFGMAAALLKRARTNRGSVVDVSLLGIAMWTLSSDVLAALQGQQPRAMSGGAAFVNPLVGTYRTKDGRHISLVFLEADRYWADFCRVPGPRRSRRRPTLRRPPGAPRARRGMRRRAPRRVREPHVRRVEDGARGTSTRPGRRCRRSRSSWTIRRCSPTTTSARW